MEPTVFSSLASEARKARGMASAALCGSDLLVMARGIARDLCQEHGSCTADDVGQILFKRHGIASLGPVAGSLFKHPDFEPTGQLMKSARKKNHARLIYVWRLRQEG